MGNSYTHGPQVIGDDEAADDLIVCLANAAALLDDVVRRIG